MKVDEKVVDELERSNKLLLQCINCKLEDQKKYDGYTPAMQFLFNDIIKRIPDDHWCVKLALKFGNRLRGERASIVREKVVQWFTTEGIDGFNGTGRVWKGDLEYVHDPMENRQQYYYSSDSVCQCLDALIKHGQRKGWSGEPTEEDLEKMMSLEFREYADIPDYNLGTQKTISNHILQKRRLCSFYGGFDELMLDVVFERLFFNVENFKDETKPNIDRYIYATKLLETIYENNKLGITEKSFTIDDISWLRLWNNNTESQKRILLCKLLDSTSDENEKEYIKSLYTTFTIDYKQDQKDSNSPSAIYKTIQEQQAKADAAIPGDSFETMLEGLKVEIKDIQEEIVILSKNIEQLSKNIEQKEELLKNRLKQRDCLETLVELIREEP